MTSSKKPKPYTTVSLPLPVLDDLRRLRLVMEKNLSRQEGKPVRLTLIATVQELMRSYASKKAS